MIAPPALILGYARTENILNTIESLISFGTRTIFVSLDGPREVDIANKQAQLISKLQVLRSSKDVNIQVRYFESNQGIAVSIITGIDWFFENIEFGLIIEDDLMVSRDFLTWCNWADITYKGNPEVFLASGNRFDTQFSGPSFARYPQTWGWATWRDRWQAFRPTYGKLNLEMSQFFSYRKSFWSGGTLRVLSKRTDTWDIPLAKYMFENSLLSVLPPTNLVSNIGIDSHATHTELNEFPLMFPVYPLGQTPLRHHAKSELELIKNEEFLEKRIFKIRKKHLFSLWKNLPLAFFYKRLGKALIDARFLTKEL